MQNNDILNSTFLSPMQAIAYLAKRNYTIGYRQISDLMRSNVIESIEKDDYARKKAPRIVTTEAALDLWLKNKRNQRNKEARLSKLQAASAEAAIEDAELASIPDEWELKLASSLNLAGINDVQDKTAMHTRIEQEAIRRIEAAQRREQVNAERRAARKRAA